MKTTARRGILPYTRRATAGEGSATDGPEQTLRSNGASAPGTPSALEGVRVLDLTHYIAGPFCTKLLADFGAEVTKIERPPAGDPARKLGPFFHDDPDPETGAAFLHLNTNKRGLTLDLKTAEGLAIAKRLAAEADIVVESFRPGVIDRLGLGYDVLREINPAVVLVSISNFGQTGPYRDFKASEIVEYAMGGAMNVTGNRDREPLKLGGNVVQYHAGSVAAFAALTALYRSEVTGEGDYIDISIYETQMGSRDRRVIYLTGYAYTGETARPLGEALRSFHGVRPTSDGYINVAGGGVRVPNVLRAIGRPDLAADPRYRDPAYVRRPDVAEELEALYLAWLQEHTMYEAVALLQKEKVLAAPVNTIAGLFADPHFEYRQPWDVIDHPKTGPLNYPGRPFIMSETPRQTPRHAPLLGEHNEEVLCGQLGYAKEDLPRLREQGII